MMIIKGFFFLLLAGISSPSIAESDADRKGFVLSVLELIHDKNAASNFATAEENNQAIFKLLKKSCDKNGGKFAYKTAKASWEHYTNCEKSANDMKSNVSEHQMRGDLVKGVHEGCSHVPNMRECTTRLRDSVEPCLEPEERGLVKVIYRVMNAVFDFTCEIDGEPMKKFVDEKGAECYEKKKLMFMSCFVEIPSLRELSDSSEELLPASIKGIAKFLPTEKDCGEIEKFRSCSVGVLKGCPHPSAAEMAELFINKLKGAMDCEIVGSAGSTSVTNGVLVTLVAALFAHFA